ncbi:MAG: hypothetical protein JXR03_02845 [Cyclobacteriaceae bacterium]
MKLFLRLILIGILTYILSFYSPWWILFIITFGVSFFLHGSSINSFISGFLGVGLVWISFAWYLDFESQSVFTDKFVGLVPQVSEGSYLIIISGLIGAISGGLGALTGNYFKLLFVKKKKKSFYS